MKFSSVVRVQHMLHEVQAAIEVKPILACSPLKQRCAFLSALRADIIAHKDELVRANRRDCEAFTQQSQAAAAAPLLLSPAPVCAAPMRGQHTVSVAGLSATPFSSTLAMPPRACAGLAGCVGKDGIGEHTDEAHPEPGSDEDRATSIGGALGPFYESAFTSRPSHHQQLFPLRFDKVFSIIDYLLEQPDPISIPQTCWLKGPGPPEVRRGTAATATSSDGSPPLTEAHTPPPTAPCVHAAADAQVEVCELRVPLGLVGFLSRYRPRMLLDATAMGIFAGNTVLLDGGASLYCTNTALMNSVRRALVSVGLPSASVIHVESYDAHSRLTVEWLHMADRVDMGLVCGPPKLFEFACRNSAIPLIRATSRSSSLLVDESASYDTAVRVILNAKQQSPGAANGVTTLIMDAHFPRYVELLNDLVEHGVMLLGDHAARERAPECISEIATDEEYRGLTQGLRDFSHTLCVKTVHSLDQAFFFLDLFGSKQSDGIIATDERVIAEFCHHVDSAVVLVNASTRLSSGGPLGCGPDLAIATSKAHCRGPFTLSALTTRKFIVRAKSESGALRT